MAAMAAAQAGQVGQPQVRAPNPTAKAFVTSSVALVSTSFLLLLVRHLLLLVRHLLLVAWHLLLVALVLYEGVAMMRRIIESFQAAGALCQGRVFQTFQGRVFCDVFLCLDHFFELQMAMASHLIYNYCDILGKWQPMGTMWTCCQQHSLTSSNWPHRDE